MKHNIHTLAIMLGLMTVASYGAIQHDAIQTTGTTASKEGITVVQQAPPAAVFTFGAVANNADLVSAGYNLAAPPTDTPLISRAAGREVNGDVAVFGAEVNADTPVAAYGTPQTTAGIQMTNQPGSTATTFTAKAPGDHARALDTGTAEKGILGATPADGNHQLE